MIKKDLNLFTAYKNSSGKAGSKDSRSVILIIMIFVIIISVAYLIISILKINKQSEINSINNNIKQLSDTGEISNLPQKTEYNKLITLYINALKSAKESFDDSVFIDSALLRDINSSMPADFMINNMKINSQTYIISGLCSDILSPAVFKQSMDAKDIFSSIQYSGVSKDSNGNYYFTITCVFKGGDAK